MGAGDAIKHGMKRRGQIVPEYSAWCQMLGRCNNPNNQSYARYGGRGIKVAAEWRTFLAFYADMGDRPSAGHSLDRIDNDKDYSKDNCRWATKQQQAANRSTSRRIEYEGKVYCLEEMIRLLSLNYHTVHCRLHRGWPIERALYG